MKSSTENFTKSSLIIKVLLGLVLTGLFFTLGVIIWASVAILW